MSQVSTLDELKLAAYLEANIEGFKGPLTVEKFPGGQSNPTFKITASSGVYVLRRQPPGDLLKSAHAVDREYRVLDALAKTEVPVAKVYHLCEDREVIGSMFYLMECCEGNIYWDPALPEVEKLERGAMYGEMVRVLAAMHKVDINQAGLGDYGKPGNYFKRQYKRWSGQYRASEIDNIDAMEALMAKLEQALPVDGWRVSLVHGDYRIDNVMFAPDNRRIIAVLDWELSTLGHPYADVGYLCMQMRMPSLTDTMLGLKGHDLNALGIPDEQQYVARYCEHMGIEKIEHLGFYVAFSFFRLAAIVQGVAKRAAMGNASNEKAAAAGGLVRPLAELGLEALQDN